MGSCLVVALFITLAAAVCSGLAGRPSDTGISFATSTSRLHLPLSRPDTTLKRATATKVTLVSSTATDSAGKFAGGAASSAGGETSSAGSTTSSADATTSSAGGVTSSPDGMTSSAGSATSSPDGTTSSAGDTTSSTGGTTSWPGGTTSSPSAGGEQPNLAGIPLWCWIGPLVVLATLLFAVVVFSTLLFLLISKQKSIQNEANMDVREVERKLDKVVEKTADKLKSAEEEFNLLTDRLDRVEYEAAVRLYQLHELHKRYMVGMGYWCADDTTQCQHEHKEEYSGGDAPQQQLKDRVSKARHPVFQKCADDDPESVFDKLVPDADPDRMPSFRAERDTPKPPTPKRRNRRLEREQSTEETSDTKNT